MAATGSDRRVKLETLLGIELPIFQAPMAGSQGSALTVAVSNTGGLGALACALLTPEAIQRELTAIKGGTSRPFNVNFFCHAPPAADPGRESRWRATLEPYYQELGVALDSLPAGPARAPFNEELAEAIAPFAPPVVSFHFGLPSDELLARVRRWAPVIMSSATTVEEARWLEERGVDVIIAQGLEAGGHRGIFLSEDLTTQSGTMALLPQIVQSVGVPVVAAGGIADARAVAAALALGAAGVQVGTAYLLCPEATTSAVHRAALASPSGHTALTNIFTGRPARSIVNRLMRELGPISAVAPPFPLASGTVAPLRARAESQGSGDFSPLWAGQNRRGCKAIPAGDLTRELAAGLGMPAAG
jgi:nitronate monooxygenase